MWAHWHKQIPNRDDRESLYAFWRKLKAAGANTVCVGYWRRRMGEPDPFRLEEIRRDAAAAKQLGLHFMVQRSVFQYVDRFTGRDLGLREAINGNGKTAIQERPHRDHVISCPLQSAYYEEAIAKPALALAQVAQEPAVQIDGMVFDPELYGTSYAFGAFHAVRRDKRTSTCFCDECFGQFMKAQGRRERIESAQRYDWLKDGKQLDAYAALLRDRLRAIFDDMFGRIRGANPDFLIAAYPGTNNETPLNWYLNAFFGAMAASPPSITFHASYQKWVVDRPRRVAGIYERLGMPVIHSPYLPWWGGDEANMVPCLNLFNMAGPGYWYFFEDRISDDFLPRLKRVNDGLDRALAACGGAIHEPTAEQLGMVSFEVRPLLVGTLPRAKLPELNLLKPHALEVDITNRGYMVDKVIVPLPESQRLRTYLLSCRVRCRGLVEAAVAYHYRRPSDGQIIKDYIIEHRGGEERVQCTGMIPVLPGVTELVLYAYRFRGEARSQEEAGTHEMREGVLVEMTEAVKWRPPETVPGDEEVVVSLPTNPSALGYHTVRQTPRGLLLMAGNHSTIPIRGMVRLRGLPGARFQALDPHQSLCVVGDTGRSWLSARELADGVPLRIPPRTARWLLVQPLAGKPEAMRDWSQAPLARLRSAGRDERDEWRRRGGPALIEFLRRKSYFNRLTDGSFQGATSLRRSANWELASGRAQIATGRAMDGDRFVSLAAGGAVRQYGVPCGAQQGRPVDFRLRAYVRCPEKGVLEARLLDPATDRQLCTAATYSMRPSQEWSYVEVPFAGAWKRSSDRGILQLRSIGGRIECDDLWLVAGDSLNPQPLTTVLRPVHTDGTEDYVILERKQLGGTYRPRMRTEVREAGAGDKPSAAIPFHSWLSRSYALFKKGTAGVEYSCRSVGEYGKKDKIDWQQESDADDSTFTFGAPRSDAPNPLAAKIVSLDDQPVSDFVRATHLGVLMETRTGSRGLPNLVVEVAKATPSFGLVGRRDGTRCQIEAHCVGLAARDGRKWLVHLFPTQGVRGAEALLVLLRPQQDDPFVWYTVSGGKCSKRESRKLVSGSSGALAEYRLVRGREMAPAN